jgi:lipoic acid synthetase/lipoate-protein ligase A
MKRICLPHTGLSDPLPGERGERLVFYLAMEEYVAAHLGEIVAPSPDGRREAFFIWQVPPTVIFGRNQVMQAEVRLDWCRLHDVALFRRKSGGGCVFSDWGNIMISYVTDATDVAFTFDRYLRRIALALRHMGLPADRSGRNDILIGGRKVSGNAFFHLPKASIVHGTLLFDTDFEAMEAAITPSGGKIRSKGVSSVRQRVANVRELLEAAGKPMDIETFKRRLIVDLSGPDTEPVPLSGEDVLEIRRIEETYLDPSFLLGRNTGCSVEDTVRIEGIGDLVVASTLREGRISDISVSGDFFPKGGATLERLQAGIAAGIIGKDYSETLVNEYINNINLNQFFYTE